MRVIRVILVLLLAAVLVAGALAWTAPAALAYRLGAGWLGPLSLQGIAGSVWDGRAQNAVMMGVALGPATWRIDRRAALFDRHVVGAFTIDGQAVRGRASVRQDATQVELHDVHATFPAALLGPALDIPALLFAGSVEIDAPSAALVDGYLTRAQGEATWRDIGIAGAAQARLPGVRVSFAPTAPGRIEATIADLGGALAIDGHVTIADARFVLEATLALREDNPQVAELLKFIGQSREDGSSYLRVDGVLTRLW